MILFSFLHSPLRLLKLIKATFLILDPFTAVILYFHLAFRCGNVKIYKKQTYLSFVVNRNSNLISTFFQYDHPPFNAYIYLFMNIILWELCTLSCSSEQMTTEWLLPWGSLALACCTSSGSGRILVLPSTTAIDMTGALCLSLISLASTAATSFSDRFSWGTVTV